MHTLASGCHGNASAGSLSVLIRPARLQALINEIQMAIPRTTTSFRLSAWADLLEAFKNAIRVHFLSTLY